MPSLIHKDVLAMVSKHLHILPHWSGRKLFVLLIFIALPFVIYSVYSNVFAKNIQDNEEVETYTENFNEDGDLLETIIGEENIQQLEQPIIEIQSFTDIQLVSRSINWSLVNSCISSETKCICYGHAIERLVVPDASCRAAVMYGWPGKMREIVSKITSS